MTGRGAPRLGDERGAIAIIVVLLMPVFLLCATLAIDASRWWVIDRHMQTQADAAALAAGTELADDPLGCTEARIVNRAKQYAGISATVAGEAAAQRYNGAEDVKVQTSKYEPNFRLNSKTWAASGPTDPDHAAFEGTNPCTSGIADVKLTTTNTPWFFRATGIVPRIDAHARTQLLTLSGAAGGVPFGLESTDHKRVWVEIVDLAGSATPVPLFKNDGTQVDGFDLTRIGPNAAGLTEWANTTTYNLRTSTSGRLGVRVRASNAVSTVSCASTAVKCYGTGTVPGSSPTQQNSLSAIRFHADPGAANTFGVRLGAVNMVPIATAGTCDVPTVTTGTEGGFFHTTCNKVRVTAHLEGLTPSLPPIAQPVVKAVVGTVETTLTYDPGSGPSGDATWTGDVPITLAGGPKDMQITWSQTGGTITTSDPSALLACTATEPCEGDFSNTHRSFSGDDSKTAPAISRVGVLEGLDVSVGTGPGQLSNNVVAGTCTAASPCPVTVTAALSGSIALSKTTDTNPVVLRESSSGSNGGLLDCDPAEPKVEREIAFGCPGNFAVNDGFDCSTFQNASQIMASTPPWYCVGTQTGNQGAKVPEGVNHRVHCLPFPGNCAPGNPGFGQPAACLSKNNWPNFNDDDPRILTVFLVETGAADFSGSKSFPILGFAAFYVTGWNGNVCVGDPDNDGDPDNELPAAYVGEPSTLVGRWISFRPPNDTNNTSGPCNLNSPIICVPVLVK